MPRPNIMHSYQETRDCNYCACRERTTTTTISRSSCDYFLSCTDSRESFVSSIILRMWLHKLRVGIPIWFEDQILIGFVLLVKQESSSWLV